MKKLIISLLFMISGVAHAQMVQQIGNQVYITDQTGIAARIEYSGNNAYIHTTPRYTPEPFNNQVITYGSGSAPVNLNSYRSAHPSSGLIPEEGSMGGPNPKNPGLLDYLIAPVMYGAQALASPFIALDLLTETRPYEMKCDTMGCHKEIIRKRD